MSERAQNYLWQAITIAVLASAIYADHHGTGLQWACVVFVALLYVVDALMSLRKVTK